MPVSFYVRQWIGGRFFCLKENGWKEKRRPASKFYFFFFLNPFDLQKRNDYFVGATRSFADDGFPFRLLAV